MAVNDNFTLRPLCFLWRNADTPWNKLAVFFWGTALQTGRSRVRFPMVSLEFCHWHNPSGRTMTLGSTQSLTEMSTRNISLGGKGGWWVGLTTLPPSCADCLGICEPQPPGTLRACPGLYRDCFPFTFYPWIRKWTVPRSGQDVLNKTKLSYPVGWVKSFRGTETCLRSEPSDTCLRSYSIIMEPECLLPHLQEAVLSIVQNVMYISRSHTPVCLIKFCLFPYTQLLL